jgi:succinoglycan biosynthesis protein ExoV
MKLCFWRGASPNFGDELNLWLWPRLLPGFFDDRDDVLFIGIGSILHGDYAAAAEKLVFGSGYYGVPFVPPPQLDERWKVYFVRGPRTAEALGIDRGFGLGDAASLVSRVPDAELLPRGSAGPAFMPHWESSIDGPWQEVSKRAGLRFIDPRWPVERILAEISSSSLLVTEAMHGAIVADALRVPWVPFAPIGMHQFKWYDWTESLGVDLRFARSAPATWIEALLRRFNGSPKMQARIRFYGRKRKLAWLNPFFRRGAVTALERARAMPAHLSSDAALLQATDAMLERLERVRRDFPRPEAGESAGTSRLRGDG